MRVLIQPEQPDSAVARELIAELDATLNPHYPPESRHGYSVEKLIERGVAFFVAYLDEQAVGCGGVQIVGSEYAELKRMYVRPGFRGRGVGKQLLAHLEAYAAGQGIRVLRLETGVHQKEAISLYQGFGFRRVPPFGPYLEDPLSLCLEKSSRRNALQPAPQLDAHPGDRLAP
ncbi:GNAT family N-acetyltransferase [Meiothermus hypogaeus]|uniref:N-acetyltransferase n=2 Tax=Meiothermus hypogaeus TaxID=884155 RepID=A0A511R3I7_9DEIN|nr:GNAT family N-acetyltransferase [Meiothermus hypogaeus]RIH78829.1 putative N-acetyltransferase YsnE [Meiothermus hypogaeus]GEM84168.1 N-acetyltransferase [Meiothermus hypogaeus NBRC 106114]